MTQVLSAFQNAGGAAVRWWIGELSDLVPNALKKDDRQTDALGIRFEEEGLTVGILQFGQMTGGQQVPEDGAALEKALSTLRRDTARTAPVDLLLAADQVFAIRQSYPAKARERLDALAALEIERSMPFGVQDVYRSSAVIETDTARQTIHVEQVFAKRSVIDDLLRRAEALGLEVRAIRAGGSVDGINLLPPEISAGRRRQRLRRRGAVWGLFVISLAVFCATLGMRQEQTRAALQDQLFDAKRKALAARAMGHEASSALKQLSALRNAKISTPSVMKAWDDLAGGLPDTAWIHQLSIRGREVRLSGFAASAAPLITALEEMPAFEKVSFAAPVTLDHQQAYEKFTIVLTLADPAREQIEEEQT